MAGQRGRPAAPPPPITKRGNGRGSVVPHALGYELLLPRPKGSTKKPPSRIHEVAPGADPARALYDAHRALDEWLDELDGLRPSRIPTLAQYHELAYRSFSASNHGADTHANYMRSLECEVLSTRLGALRVDEIRPSHVNALTAGWVQRGMTQGTIKNYLKPLRQMMKQAKVEYGLPVLHINCDDTPVPRVAARKSGRKHIFFDYDEATRFVDYCLGETPDVELYGPFFATCVLLGLRPSNEGWAIREDAINADTGEITIAAALKRAGNGAPLRIGDLKTGDSAWRRLDMPPEVSIAIKQQKATMERFGIKPADRRWDGLIFLPMNGKPPTRKTMEKHLTRICRNADVRRLPVYDLRHSCATILIENGMSYEDVAWMLGTSVTMLTEHYRHRYGDGPRGLADSWRRVRESVDDNARTR